MRVNYSLFLKILPYPQNFKVMEDFINERVAELVDAHIHSQSGYYTKQVSGLCIGVVNASSTIASVN